jgi:hypothetical protein
MYFDSFLKKISFVCFTQKSFYDSVLCLIPKNCYRKNVLCDFLG